MRKGFILFILLSALALQGCASFNRASYSDKLVKPTNPDTIKIFQSFPPRSFEKIGEVSAKGAQLSNWDSLYNRLKKEASLIGGDAIVLIKTDTPLVGVSTSSGHSETTFDAEPFGSGITGTAITNYSPPTSTPIFGKSILGIVIKFTDKEQEKP